MARRGGKTSWTWEKRQALRYLIGEEGFTPKIAAKELLVSDQTVYKELRKGTTADEYLDKRYAKYSPEKALLADALEAFGEEQLAVIVETYHEYFSDDKEDRRGSRK
ncbi:MAG: hypothetical protein SOR78_06010 [Baileyella intestinalis]|uniref:hypothetical protein n=1 Tax=Baileyella intestinalis TaxID=2606709 RepID=UPI002A75FDC1|nr:hypothetical protein [Baileyella intestinalis]MDY2995295.1 hypothetical protein [Baileyella intestinalis]